MSSINGKYFVMQVQPTAGSVPSILIWFRQYSSSAWVPSERLLSTRAILSSRRGIGSIYRLEISALGPFMIGQHWQLATMSRNRPSSIVSYRPGGWARQRPSVLAATPKDREFDEQNSRHAIFEQMKIVTYSKLMGRSTIENFCNWLQRNHRLILSTQHVYLTAHCVSCNSQKWAKH